MHCPSCGTLLQHPNQRHCHKCGASAQVTQPESESRPQHLHKATAASGAPRPSYLANPVAHGPGVQQTISPPPTATSDTDRNADIWAIIVVIVLEVLGDRVAAKQGTTAFAIVLWVVATVVAIYLVATKSIANKIVGSIKIILFAIWLCGAVITGFNDKLSGTYSTPGSVASITFTPDGHYTLDTHDGDPPIASTYTLSGNVLELSVTGGQAPSSPDDAELLGLLAQPVQIQMSQDHSSFELANMPFTKTN